MKERARSARALASFLPPEVAELGRDHAISAVAAAGGGGHHPVLRHPRFLCAGRTLPAREVAEVVDRHLAAMVEGVTSNGGVLDKFAGDAVMAVFGAPRQATDHARRALACAVAMQCRQTALNSEAEHAGLPAFEIGIGINTGTVIVLHPGSRIAG